MEYDKFLFEDKIRNKTRKNLLLLLYQSPKRYQDLASLTGLKPGSVYHHLKLLEPFVEKKAHGLYSITDLGKQMVEMHGLVSEEEKKPSIDHLHFENDPLEAIFTNRGTQILIIFVIVLTFHLGQLNVAIAGGAIYATFNVPAFAIDVLSFILGIGILAYVSSIFRMKDKIRFVILVRLYLMIPASLMGLGLLLAYHSGIPLSNNFNTALFTISFAGGVIVGYAGIKHLLGKDKREAILYASVSALPDLFIGLVVLLIDS